MIARCSAEIIAILLLLIFALNSRQEKSQEMLLTL
jgi:hypothetical protein